MASSILDVIEHDVCVGCGACVLAAGDGARLRLTEDGRYVADLSAVDLAQELTASSVCPFSYDRQDVDALASLQEWRALPKDTAVGHRLAVYTGRIRSRTQIVDSSSGGLTTWLLRSLLEKGLVDGVIHVGPQERDAEGVLFSYRVSTTVQELEVCRKSHYSATNYVDAVRAIRGNGKRYAFVGVSCFVSSLRQLTAQDSVLRAQLPFFVGLVCGHLKTQRYAASLAWQVGVSPADLDQVDFRVKVAGAPVSSYAFGARGRGEDRLRVIKNRELVGTNWGHTAFQLKACDFCDDIFAEAADITFGDAWLPQFSSDWEGTNMVVSRDNVLDSILREGRDRGEIVLDHSSPDQALASQGGNFRHRRSGLATRVTMDRARGRWVPPTRASTLDLFAYEGARRQLVAFRRTMATASRACFTVATRTERLGAYLLPMRALIVAYRTLDRLSRRSSHVRDSTAQNMRVRVRQGSRER
ncbi:Coenzyme F420 hydrogenase/dehydrogenase, beta subunit C-terminal domain [Ornithinimicrobium kibberense]|uniref:Coenzyme F420 hydrogenase/dehydrogenase, beta subunit C-terminal domain n=1 Tax=Ornithinimicrobium kibberense TaxID=282060 RepID=A0ABV5V1S5_9MICO|nr:Coenzyme F420 hydrogenase/dehydrogenase, beta subunit C-terminal domain [Ornithinimicrobium kibberense]